MYCFLPYVDSSLTWNDDYEPVSFQVIFGFSENNLPSLDDKPLLEPTFAEDASSMKLLSEHILVLVKVLATVGDGNCYFR